MALSDKASVVIRAGNSSCYCPAVSGEGRNVAEERSRWRGDKGASRAA